MLLHKMKIRLHKRLKVWFRMENSVLIPRIFREDEGRDGERRAEIITQHFKQKMCDIEKEYTIYLECLEDKKESKIVKVKARNLKSALKKAFDFLHKNGE